MKKSLFTIAFILISAISAHAYDFSAVCSTGQTLYYSVYGNSAWVVPELGNDPYYNSYPTGNLVIPDSVSYHGTTYPVTEIGEGAFGRCSQLTSVTIPNTVTYIARYAFIYCRGLCSIEIPNSVTYIGDGAFSDISNVIYSGSATGSWGCRCVNGYMDGNLVYKDATKTYLAGCCQAAEGDIVIPPTVDTIGYNAFNFCRNITNVTIPNSVTYIGSNAFYYCDGLTSISIPNSVTYIGSGAFAACRMCSIEVPNTVTYIGASAFSSMINVIYGGSATGYWGCGCVNGYMDGNLVYKDANKTYLVGCCRTEEGSIVIPSTVDTIGNNAFSGCGLITNVIIPESVTSIGLNAFYGCIGLTTVTIPNSVERIGKDAFSGCSSLLTINYNATNCSYYYRYGNSYVTCYSCEVFDGDTAVTQINIGENVQSLPSYAFNGCTNVTEIHSFANTPPAIMEESYTFGSRGADRTTSVYIPCGTYGAYSQAEGWGSTFENLVENDGTLPTVVSADIRMGDARFTTATCVNHMAEIKAFPNDGYRFVNWQDGNTDNPRTINTTNNVTYTAYFELIPEQYTITVVSSNTSMGTTSGGGTYDEGTTITLTASAHNGYRFLCWQDNNTDNPRTITVNEDAIYTAYFEVSPSQYTVTAISASSDMGDVTGGGSYYYGDVATLTASAFSGYHFLHWNDNVTDNPRTVTVTSHATYIAYFEADAPTQYTITVNSANPSMGSVTGGGTYAEGSTVTLTATPNNGYSFLRWREDNNTDNPRTITVTGDRTYTAIFQYTGGSEPQQYLVTVNSIDETMGTVTGGGLFDEGTVTTIMATAKPGYLFVQWQDGNTQRIRTITVTGDATYTAYFDYSNGIDDMGAADDVKIYTRGNIIVIDFSGQHAADSRQSVVVYDVMGRVIKQAADGCQQAAVEIPVTSAGVYMVKVGERPTRKVIVKP